VIQRQQHALRRRRRTLIERRVRDLQTCQARDLRLELEESLKRPLARLGLVGRVRGQELPAQDELIDERRDEVVVRPAAEKARRVLGAQVVRAACRQLALKLQLRRPRRQIELAAEADLVRNHREELVDRRHADRLEHLESLGLRNLRVVHPCPNPSIATPDPRPHASRTA
jgi:hypothetical protein